MSSVVITIVVIFAFSTLNLLDKTMGAYIIQKEYYFIVFECVSLLITIFTIMICGFSFLDSNDQYRLLVLTSGVTREKFFITKLLVIIISLFLFVFFITLVVYLCPLFYRIYINSIDIIIFIDLFIGSLYYFFITLILIELMNNYYTVFISLTLFLVTRVSESKDFMFILPVYINNYLIMNKGYYLLMIIIMFLISLSIYMHRDLSY